MSDTTLLALRCAPIYKPYIAEDVTSDAGFIVDTVVTHTQARGAKPIVLQSAAKSMPVSISIGHNILAVGTVPVNATKSEVPFSLTRLTPRKEPYNVSCSATYGNQKYTTTTSLSYLPIHFLGRSPSSTLAQGDCGQSHPTSLITPPCSPSDFLLRMTIICRGIFRYWTT